MDSFFGGFIGGLVLILILVGGSHYNSHPSRVGPGVSFPVEQSQPQTTQKALPALSRPVRKPQENRAKNNNEKSGKGGSKRTATKTIIIIRECYFGLLGRKHCM